MVCRAALLCALLGAALVAGAPSLLPGDPNYSPEHGDHHHGEHAHHGDHHGEHAHHGDHHGEHAHGAHDHGEHAHGDHSHGEHAHDGQAHSEAHAHDGQVHSGTHAHDGQAHPGTHAHDGQAHSGAHAHDGHAHPEPQTHAGLAHSEPQAHAGQAHDGQAHVGLAHPEPQAHDGQAHAGQAHPEPQAANDAFPAAFPGQAFPGQAFPGQAFPGQAFAGQAFPGQEFPGQTHSGLVSGDVAAPQPGSSLSQGIPDFPVSYAAGDSSAVSAQTAGAPVSIQTAGAPVSAQVAPVSLQTAPVSAPLPSQPSRQSNPFLSGAIKPPSSSSFQVPVKPVPAPAQRPTPEPIKELNTNPLGGPAGPKGPVRASCPGPASALPCVREEECDPYTGFLKSDGVKLPDPITKDTPTVAIGQCRLGGGVGVCCKKFPRPKATTTTTAVPLGVDYGQGLEHLKRPPTEKPANPFLPGYKPSY